ncbi:mitochondrial glycoprotein [Mortierella sp. GBAus27b]|nr:hypothetical protein BGX31_004782 [Mortierella sp. GBA43]KAI8351064.1 mitochondrial glycoprotein [Mortierella sp. GBAus27b]
MFALRTAVARVVPSLALRAATLPRTAVAPAVSFARAGSLSAFRSFSHTPLARNQTDKSLINVLQNEIDHEEGQAEEVPELITSYLKSSPFKIADKPGSDEVVLTRKFGSEDIRVVFSVSDINAADDDAELDFEDDLEEDGQQGNQSLSASGADEDEAGDDLESLTFPVRCLITISKPDAGSISIDAIAQDGAFIIESVSNLKDSALATASTAEADWEKRGLYSGPPFAELDEELQVSFEKYLDERQIDGDLANFVPNYVFHKDQVEYTNWLKELKAFVAK